MDYSNLSADEQAKKAADNFMDAAKNLQDYTKDLEAATKNVQNGFSALVDNEKNKNKAETIQAIAQANKILADLKSGKFDYKAAIKKLNALKLK